MLSHVPEVISSNPAYGKVYLIQHFVIKFVSSFLWVFPFPPTIKDVHRGTFLAKCADFTCSTSGEENDLANQKSGQPTLDSHHFKTDTTLLLDPLRNNCCKFCGWACSGSEADVENMNSL